MGPGRSLPFTIREPRRDGPLVFVNPASEQTTDYSGDEALGRSCRFLQGPDTDTDPRAVHWIREAVDGQEHTTVTLLTSRKDRTALWNEVSLSLIYDADGGLTHFVGIQADVTARVHVEQERERHLIRAAARAAEKAQRRLALLAEATSMLAATLGDTS